MTNDPEDFAALFTRAKTGCPEALGELFTRYAPRVRAVIHRRFTYELRRQFDSVDCAHDVWLSFFRTSLSGLDFPTERKFLAYLAHMTVNKIGEEQRRVTGAVHDVTRVESLDQELPVLGPTVSQQAVAEEVLEKLAAELTPPQRQMLELLRSGCTHEEIGEKLGIHKKTVQRLLQRLKLETGMDS